jgi:glucose/arabinose dehydrogenase
MIRVDPGTGEGVAGNPRFASSNANERRVVANGLRNPFRFTHRPGTNEVWVGDVGARIHEEINRLASPTDGSVDNFGWPCYEGPDREPGFDSTNLAICENLYAAGANAVVPPVFSYRHDSEGGPYPRVRPRPILRLLLP